MNDRIRDFLSHRQATDKMLRGEEGLGGEERCNLGFFNARRGDKHAFFRIGMRVCQLDAQHEAIELRFRKGISTFHIQRVLGGEDVKGLGNACSSPDCVTRYSCIA